MKLFIYMEFFLGKKIHGCSGIFGPVLRNNGQKIYWNGSLLWSTVISSGTLTPYLVFGMALRTS